jgi:hypothetical protein
VLAGLTLVGLFAACARGSNQEAEARFRSVVSWEGVRLGASKQDALRALDGMRITEGSVAGERLLTFERSPTHRCAVYFDAQDATSRIVVSHPHLTSA